MIELKRVCAAYDKVEKLHAVTARFERGGITVLLGPNGCGKSTLLKAAAGLLPVTSGEVLVDGAPAAALGAKELAKRIAFLPQSRNVPNLSVQRLVLHGRFPYLGYPRRYTQADFTAVERALRLVGIEPLAHCNMAALSGGERQKAYLALALAQDTDAVLMDEPTTYLDIDCQMTVWQLAQTLRDMGKAVVIVTHDLPQALRTAQQVLVMQQGQVAGCGTPSQVMEQGVLSRVFHVQIHRHDGHFYLE